MVQYNNMYCNTDTTLNRNSSRLGYGEVDISLATKKLDYRYYRI